MLAHAEDIEVFVDVCVMLIHQHAAWERETGKLFRVQSALRCGCCCRSPPSPLFFPAIGHFQHCHVPENTYEEKPECEMEKSSRSPEAHLRHTVAIEGITTKSALEASGLPRLVEFEV